MNDLKTTIERAITNQGSDPAVLAQLAADAIEGKLPDEAETFAVLLKHTWLTKGLEAMNEMLNAKCEGKSLTGGESKARIAELEKVLEGVESWWLGGASDKFIGAPFCIFDVRKALKSEDAK